MKTSADFHAHLFTTLISNASRFLLSLLIAASLTDFSYQYRIVQANGEQNLYLPLVRKPHTWNGATDQDLPTAFNFINNDAQWENIVIQIRHPGNETGCDRVIEYKIPGPDLVENGEFSGSLALGQACNLFYDGDLSSSTMATGSYLIGGGDCASVDNCGDSIDLFAGGTWNAWR